MSLRFRKSFKLAPGLRLNLSKSGFGLSVGPRGASMSFGPNGTYRNVSLPGGFSFRDRVGRPTQHRPSCGSESQQVNVNVSICLEDDGTVIFKDPEGKPLPSHLQDLTKKQQGVTVKAWLSKNCDEINNKIESLDRVHLATPSPFQKPVYTPIQFNGEPPVSPVPKPLGILGHFLPWVRRRIEAENDAAEVQYDDRLKTWRECKCKHEQTEADRRLLLQERLYKEVEAMQMVLESRLATIEWPRETNIATEISPDGKLVGIDVDLPEIEDMPRKTATYSGRGWKVTIKELSDSKVAQLYMRHVHGIAFRVIGEIFSALPTVQSVVLSGYSQRPNKATGQIQNEYLYSVKVSRAEWGRVELSQSYIDRCYSGAFTLRFKTRLIKEGRIFSY